MAEPTLDRTRIALLSVKSHLEEVSDAEIESFLVQHLAIIFYSEMEYKISVLVRELLGRFTDQRVAGFLAVNMASIIKRINKSDISGFVSSFGDEVKNKFNEKIDDSDVTLYSNVITARHKIGHGPGVNIALEDVDAGIEVAEKLLRCLEDSLAA